MADPTWLTRLLAENGHIVAPGVYDALTALIGEQAGFQALYVSGASLAYSRLGRPDIGFLGLTEVADAVARIRERVSARLIVDADTGFGNALNVVRTVKTLETAGASAIQLEDQAYPKRCGHLAGKVLIGADEMAGKIRAAVDARRDTDTLIVARTDAIAVEGFEPALERAEKYVEAGADVLFIEAPRTEDELRAIAARFAGRVPLLANMVEGGRTPLRAASELAGIGFSVVIFPGGLARMLARQAQRYFESLKRNGSNAPMQGEMLDFRELNELVGLPEILALGEQYEGPSRKGD